MSRVLKHLLKEEETESASVEKIQLDLGERPQPTSIPKLVIVEPEKPKRNSNKKAVITPPPFKHHPKFKPVQAQVNPEQVLLIQEQNINREAINLFHDQKFDQALEKFKEIAKNHPNSPSAQSNLGMTYFKLGQNEQAKKSLLSAVTLNPNDVIAYNNLGMMSLAENDYFVAVSYFEKAIQVSPSFPDSQLNLGKTHEQLGKPEKAILEYEAYIALNTGDPVVKKVLGKRVSKLRSITRYFEKEERGKD